MRGERVGVGLVVVGVLLDLAPALVQRDLLADGGLDSPADEAERVHVLQLPAGAQLVGAGRADGDVRVAAQRPFLHARVGDAERDDRLAEQLEEALRLLGGVEVGLRDDLDERRPAAVEVDQRAVGADLAAGAAAEVHGLGGVLFEMRANEADLEAFGARHCQGAADAERQVVLGDLVALRVVGVEVVLPAEDRARGDLGAEREAELDRPLDRRAIRDGERAGMGQADRAGARVLGRAEAGLAAAEHLRPRLQVDVDLQADHRLPVPLRCPQSRHLRSLSSSVKPTLVLI